MIPQVSIEVISEIVDKLLKMSDQSYKTQDVVPFQQEIKNLQKKQPFLLSWFALFCQGCNKQGMRPQEIVALEVVFIAILKSLYAQSEVSELERLFDGDVK